MEPHRDDVVSTRPTKVYSDDQLAIEIPETAHQISSALAVFMLDLKLFD
ncbi:hypothetical protein Hanom_Chr12g01114391 [Helianthus anomalus]